MTSAQFRGASSSTLLLFAVAVFVARAVNLMLGPLLVELAGEFHTSIAVAGQLAAVTFITWGIAAPLVGPISDTYGRRPVLLTGLALMAVGVLGSAAAWSYSSLLVFRLITGAGGGMLPPTMMAALADYFPPETRGKAVGFLTSSSWIGVALGVPAIALLGDLGGWRLPFFITGSLSVLVWGLLWLGLPKGQRQIGTSLAFFDRFKELARNSAPWYVLVANASMQVALIGLMTYLAAHLIENYGWNEGRTAPALALMGVGAIIGSMSGGFIAGRLRRLDWLITVGLAGGVLTGLLFALPMSAWFAMVLAFGASVSLSVSMPVLMTMMMKLAEQSRATASGVFGSSNQIGGVLGAAAGGLMLSLGGFSIVGLFCLAAAGLSAAVIMLKMRNSPEFRIQAS